MRSVTTEAIQSLDTARQATRGTRTGRIAGLAIASLAPAIFWMVVIEIVAYWLGRPLSPATITMVGATIALFLFAICAPLMLRADADR
jgi:hypothetical protein